MISNATLIAIDLPNPADAAGDVDYATVAGLSVRCALGSVEAAEQFAPDERLEGGSAKLTVLDASLAVIANAAARTPSPGQRYHVQAEGESAAVYRVHSATHHPKGGLSHWVVQLSL